MASALELLAIAIIACAVSTCVILQDQNREVTERLMVEKGLCKYDHEWHPCK